MRREVMTQQDIQHIVVDMRGDGGSQQFAAELEHPADSSKSNRRLGRHGE